MDTVANAQGTAMVPAYIGMGGNVGDVRASFAQAAQAMRQWPETQLDSMSSLYQSAPWGGVDQDDYLNAVVAIRTGLTAQTLLRLMRGLEHAHGRDRDRETRWGPRTLDLDLLLYGDHVIDTVDLQVPHPRMLQRAFVMVPLLELVPRLRIPGHGDVTQAVAQWSRSGADSELVRLPPILE